MNKMKELTILALVALAVVVAQAADKRPLRQAPADAKAMADRQDRPNIIFMLADDLRADAVGYAENEVVQTPNIDRFAKEGTRFTNFNVQNQ